MTPLSNMDGAQLRERLRLRVAGRVRIGGRTDGGEHLPGGRRSATWWRCKPAGARRCRRRSSGCATGRSCWCPSVIRAGWRSATRASHLRTAATVACSDGLLGRVIDAMGRPIDGKGPIPGPSVHRPLYAEPPGPLTRRKIKDVLPVGVRAIDGALPLGRGQRIGILAGAGVGKSSLLGMLATGCRGRRQRGGADRRARARGRRIHRGRPARERTAAHSGGGGDVGRLAASPDARGVPCHGGGGSTSVPAGSRCCC